MSAVSFSFLKKSEPSKVKKAPETSSNEEKKDFVLSLEGKEINSTLPKAEKKELVIPMIGKNKWRQPPSQIQSKKGDERKSGKSLEEVALEKEAAEAVLKDHAEAQLTTKETGTDYVVPLLLQNHPPVIEGKEKDDLADVDLRPEQSTLEEYDAVPIESFGAAVLRGMGWTKGTAIGLSNKGLVEPIEFIPRLGGLGLGAAPRAPPPVLKRKIKKPGEVERKVRGPYVDNDGRVKHYKKVGEEIPDQPLQGFCVGNFAKVLRGPHENLCGKIVSVDEDTARVILKMAINNQTLSFSQHHLELVSKDEYLQRGREGGHKRREEHEDRERSIQGKQYGLVTKTERSSLGEPSPKRSKRDNEISRESDKRTSRHHNTDTNLSTEHSAKGKSNSDHDSHTYQHSKKHSEDKYTSDHSSKSNSTRTREHEDRYLEASGATSSNNGQRMTKEKSWLYSNLRVRMIDQKYRKGKYYNTKMVVLDVISLGVCVCQDDNGKLIEGITESMLETVVPRSSRSKVMIVRGKRKGEIGTIIEQDRRKAKAVVEISLSKKVLEVDFDDICEFTGHIDDDM